ncbi:uncharacterized protein LOC132718657 [Ruditapes philippinarum]|uniref:uncharacterized protein LOC132718657 n=1 Tax=Ruditapes philippinarum TaxID=129788 RepID=UPI00295B3B1E|nr:uncharacterized protein LOC132718657 [Ruditapes philippinarum]
MTRKKKKKKMKLPSCFGFISTWIAKRKEKRRQKKKKAIASRAPTPTLVQYEHRKSRGGESFTIEVDCKPIVMKPILPPIKTAGGPIRLACEARQEKAEAKRNEEFIQKENTGKRAPEKKKLSASSEKTKPNTSFRKECDSVSAIDRQTLNELGAACHLKEPVLAGCQPEQEVHWLFPPLQSLSTRAIRKPSRSAVLTKF